MSVTGKESGSGSAVANRNERLASLEAVIEGQAVTDDDAHPASWDARCNAAREEEARRRRALAHRAQRTCESCGKCGRELEPTEPVTRERLPMGYNSFSGNFTYWMAPVCDDCASPYTTATDTGDCESCGRPVSVEPRWRGRHYFCSDRCRDLEQQRARKAERLELRENRRCRGCGETYTASRTDARYCSNACRQKEYRERKVATT